MAPLPFTQHLGVFVQSELNLNALIRTSAWKSLAASKTEKSFKSLSTLKTHTASTGARLARRGAEGPRRGTRCPQQNGRNDRLAHAQRVT